MSSGLDLSLGFGTLVTGAANQLAVSAARAMAESAQPPFNPLIIHGGEGLGKTHLLHAIGLLRLDVEPRAVVRIGSWSELVDGWRSAQVGGRGREFLSPFVECGLLLLDDVHRLLERGEARQQLLDVLETRISAGRSTVLASRKSPAELIDADPAGARILATGLGVELNPPDSAMRWEIMARQSGEGGVGMTPAVLEEIAGLPFTSIRDLVSAARRLLAFQAVSPTSLDPAQARVLITGVLDEPLPDTGVRTAAPEPARPPSEPRSPLAEESDEFGSFLSDVVASVSQQVDRWRGRIADAMLRWQGEGYHTARLQALLDHELATQPEEMLHRFEADLDTLRRLEQEARELAPDIAAHEAFKDPDQLTLAQQLLDEARVRDLVSCLPQSQYRLDDLVEGPSNRLALDTARGVAAEPGGGPNPLLVVGDSGVGKTHLLHGIGNALVEQEHRGVVCVGAHGLEASLQEAADTDQLPAWRRRFRWASALLIDDVHLLAGRSEVQQELAGLLDHLLSAGRQVVFSSAVPVAELTGLAPQLLARLAAGIVVEMPRPDHEVRLEIVARLLSATEAADDAALAEYLAARPADGIRAVHATVQRVLRAAESGRSQLGLALARQVLDAPPRAAPRQPASPPGILGPTVGGPRLREKLVDRWPHAGDRLIEDFR
ncbi:MAG TPA: DnaA/Hda family protein [Gemmatimonadales bacterium]